MKQIIDSVSVLQALRHKSVSLTNILLLSCQTDWAFRQMMEEQMAKRRRKQEKQLMRGLHSCELNLSEDEWRLINFSESSDLIVKYKMTAPRTSAMIIAVLKKIDASSNKLQSLVLINEESVGEVGNQLSALGKYMGIKCFDFYITNNDVSELVKQLDESRYHVVVATHKTFNELIGQKKLDTSALNIVLDLTQSKTWNQSIYHGLVGQLETTDFRVVMLGDLGMGDPPHVLSSARLPVSCKSQLILSTFQHFKVPVSNHDIDKRLQMAKLLKLKMAKAVVFCRRATEAETLLELMQGDWLGEKKEDIPELNYLAKGITQDERDQITKTFSQDTKFKRWIVVTDELARDFVVQDTTLFINWTIPKYYNEYLTRIGLQRQDKSRKRLVINLLTEDDEKLMSKYEKKVEMVDAPFDLTQLNTA